MPLAESTAVQERPMENIHAMIRRGGILYFLMLIAAVAAIVFSVAGIATMLGWLPGAQSRPEAAPARDAPGPKGRLFNEAQRALAAKGSTHCPDCGVIESIGAVEVIKASAGDRAIRPASRAARGPMPSPTPPAS
jgi:hypothetical protein